MPERKKIQVKYQEVGESGTLIFSGQITGEEYNPDLRGRKGMKVYDKMRSNDTTVGQALWAPKYSILAADWDIQASGDTPLEQEIAQSVHHNLFEILKFRQSLLEGLTCLDFGFSLFEMVFEPRDVTLQDKKTGRSRNMRQIVLSKLGWRKPTTIFAWETQDGQPGITQMTQNGTFNIPDYKLARITLDQEGDNYEGRSMLRRAYKHWYYKDKYYKIEAMGFERQHVGVPFAHYPAGASTDEKAFVKKLLMNMRANHQAYMMSPIGWEQGFMDMGSGGKVDIAPAIDHQDVQILRAAFADFMALGQRSSGGNRSLSEDRSRFFELAVKAVADLITEVFNERIIKTLVDINYTTDKYPKLIHGKIGDENLPVISEAVAKFVGAKALNPRPEDENPVRKMMGWAELSEEEIAERKKAAEEARKAMQQAGTPAPTDNKGRGAKKPEPDADESSTDIKASAVLEEAKVLQAKLTRALYGDTRQAA